MEHAFGFSLEDAVEVFVAGAVRLRVLDEHVVVGQLLALGQVEPVQNALEPFAGELHVNVVPRQSRPEGERVGLGATPPSELSVQRGDVKRFLALALELHMLYHRVVADDQFRDGVREIGGVRGSEVALDNDQSALFPGNDQVARMRRRAGLFAGRDEQ